jgi:hypothetical protein
MRVSYHSHVDEHTTTKPARSPARGRPGRRRRHERPDPPHGPRRIADEITPADVIAANEHLEPQTGGGGSSGRGPVDDDGGGRKPDRDGDARNLLIALGLIAVGATVMSARLLAKAGRQPHTV